MADGSPFEVLSTVPATTRSVRWVGRKSVAYDLTFEDWAIAGIALRDRVAARWGVPDPPPELTPLSTGDPAAAVAAIRRLLGEAAPDFDDGRVALLVCPIDRDLACRALSARVVTGPDTVEWRDVGWQVTYEPFVPEADEYGPLLSFRFDRGQYEEVVRARLDRYRAAVVEQPHGPDAAAEPRRRPWFRRR